MKIEEKYKYVIKEYSRRAARYDLSSKGFISTSQVVAIETLNPQRGERVLDAGCGSGAVIGKVAKAVGEEGEAVGIDLSEDMLSIAKKKLSEHNNVALINGNLESISYPNNYFDAVVNVNVMHYLYDIDAVLSEFYRLLKPKGRLVLVGFCRDYFFFGMVEKLWRIFIPSHIRAYSRDELSRKVKKAGFEIVESRRFKIGFFWRSMVLKARKR